MSRERSTEESGPRSPGNFSEASQLCQSRETKANVHRRDPSERNREMVRNLLRFLSDWLQRHGVSKVKKKTNYGSTRNSEYRLWIDHLRNEFHASKLLDVIDSGVETEVEYPLRKDLNLRDKYFP